MRQVSSADLQFINGQQYGADLTVIQLVKKVPNLTCSFHTFYLFINVFKRPRYWTLSYARRMYDTCVASCTYCLDLVQVTRLPVFYGTIAFLRDVSRFPTSKKQDAK